MKHTLALLALVLSLATVVNSAEVKPWYSNISVGTYGALEHSKFDAPEYGAGTDIGIKLSKDVTLSIDVMAFKDVDWAGSSVDRLTLLGKYELFSSANKAVTLYGLGGFGRQLETDNWLFTAGGGAKFKVYKELFVFADSRVYAEFNGSQGLSSRFGLGYQF
jgi:hypothetical protein